MAISSDTIDVLRIALSGGVISKQYDWDIVLEELDQQAMVPVFMLCKEVDFPKQCISRVLKEIAWQQKKMGDIAKAQQNITNRAEEYGIKAIVLKGLSLSQYYNKPESRTVGDIDLLQETQEDFDAVKAVIQNQGFKVSNEENHLTFKDCLDNGIRHVRYKKDGIIIELHTRFVGVSSLLDDHLKNTIPVKVKINEFEFWTFPTLENGLIILEHVKDHFLRRGVGLRPVIDWFFYVRKVLTDEYWDNEFEDEAEKYGLKGIAIYLTRLCELYFGLEEHRFSHAADVALCYDFMEIVSLDGNFGKSNVLGNRIRRINDYPKLFSSLQNNGLKKWDACQENPILRPFAWVYSLVDILKKVLYNKDGLSKIMASKKQIETRKHIIDEMGLRPEL